MDLQELKSVWLAYDEKISANRKLSELVVLRMIKEKSKGILARMQNELLRACLLCVALIIFFSASALGNAFDFTQAIQYVPVLAYIGCTLVALVLLLREHGRLRSVNLTKDTLQESLKNLIHSRDQFLAVVKKVWVLIPLTSGIFLFSLVARTLETYGVLKFTLIVGTLLIGNLLLVILARTHVQLFKDAYSKELKENLRELEEIREL